jgi:hypothetical protein
MASKKQGKYIGDAAVGKFLEQYKSQTPFYVVRLRVLGALASPNKDLLPVMVVASFWAEDAFPKFVTKDEAETFFSTFMGLWRRMEKTVAAGQQLLSTRLKFTDLEDVKALLGQRIEEIEAGFIEGFWGGVEDMKMPSATAALIDGLSDEAEAYQALLDDISNWHDYTPVMRDALREEIEERDSVVEDAMKALLLLKQKSDETSH